MFIIKKNIKMEFTATNSITPHDEINFSMLKESVMKYCSSVMMGGIVASCLYLYHMDDEFSKAFDFHQADLVHEHTHGRSHFTLFMSLKL
jgi:hypothetical protein